MSDNGDKLQPENKENKEIKLTITLNQDSQISVQAPGNGQLYDIPLCLYLMDLAKDHIKAINRKVFQPKIIKPQSGLWGMKNRVKGAFGK